jgi:hypothetical protein
MTVCVVNRGIGLVTSGGASLMSLSIAFGEAVTSKAGRSGV